MSGRVNYRQQTYQWEMPKQLAQPASGTIPTAPQDFGRPPGGPRRTGPTAISGCSASELRMKHRQSEESVNWGPALQETLCNWPTEPR